MKLAKAARIILVGAP
ncbi:hypothetical protein O988_04455, partial [Pseudogymnoascus sp. VKM F-3808]